MEACVDGVHMNISEDLLAAAPIKWQENYDTVCYWGWYWSWPLTCPAFGNVALSSKQINLVWLSFFFLLPVRIFMPSKVCFSFFLFPIFNSFLSSRMFSPFFLYGADSSRRKCLFVFTGHMSQLLFKCASHYSHTSWECPQANVFGWVTSKEINTHTHTHTQTHIAQEQRAARC